MEKLEIRPVLSEDAKALLEIYAPFVRDTAISFEYEVPSLQEFSNRIENISQKFPYLVLCKDGLPIGYAYASTFHARAAYDKSVELSIYVKKNFHSKGYGRLLYKALESELKKRGFAVMYACIAASSRNPDKKLTDDSIKFHEKMGFENAGYFKNCAKKFGCWYNIVYMQKNLLDEYKDDTSSDESIEVVDVYDNQKRITGKTFIRTDKFTRDRVLRDIVHICIFNSEKKLLIQQRAFSKKSGAAMWDFSASGQVISGESSQQGAMRELKEELGLSLTIKEAPVVTKIFFNSYNDYYVIPYDIELKNLKLQESEVQNVKWASREEVLQLHKEKKFLSYPKSLIELIFDVGEGKD